MTQTGWVIGGAGFLGTALSEALIRREWRVGGVGRGHNKVGERFWLPGDVSEALLEGLERETGLPDFVFHAAGSGTVAGTSANPDRSRSDTVESVSIILRFLDDRGANTRFVYPSSCAVYGQADLLPTPESAPRRPLSLYGSQKAEVEDLCVRAHRNDGVKASLLRYFSIYGPGLRKQLLWDVAVKLHSGDPVLRLAGDGTEARDFLHIDDAIELAIKAGTTQSNGQIILNGGTGRAASISEIAQRMIDRLAPDTELVFTGVKREGDPNTYVADMTKAKEELAFEAAWTWEQGVDSYCEWFGHLGEADDSTSTPGSFGTTATSDG